MTILGGGDAQPSEEQLAAVRAKMGLDQPLYVQYLTYFGKLARGDLGESLANGRAVSLDIGLRLPRTLQLIVPTIGLAVLIGVPLGIVAARTRRGWVDPGQQPLEFLRRLILPVTALTFSPLATTMRMTRTSMLEQMNMDYVRTARAKGLGERVVIYRHALRNALLPVVTVIGLQFGNMFAGSVLAEYLFNWPGLNNLMFRAIGLRDYPVVQGVILCSSFMFLVVNFLTDVSYALMM